MSFQTTGKPLAGWVLNSDDVYIDTTCMMAKIHVPVDWVLIKDCAQTIIKAILVAIKHGLKHRIKAPECILSELNTVRMSITSLGKNRRRVADRKRKFRELKRLAKVISSHGKTYLNLLRTEWSESTDLSEAEIAFVAVIDLTECFRFCPWP